MKILFIQNCEAEGPGIFEEYLKEHDVEYEIFPAFYDKKFPSLKKYQAFIVGGAPISTYHRQHHHFLQKEWNFLQRALELNKPILGICFGAQLLAELLGAQVKRNPKLEIGIYDVHLTPAGKKSRFFYEFPETLPVFQWHGDTFQVPKRAHLLVTGKDCRNQAFSYKNSLGLQFHLEVTSREVEKWASCYKNDLTKINKTKTRVVNECRRSEKELKRLAFLFMDNFFRSITPASKLDKLSI